MGLFTSKDKTDNPPPAPGAAGNEIRKLAGAGDLAATVRAAPSDPSEARIETSKPSRGRPSVSRSGPAATSTEQSEKDRQKQERKERSLRVIGSQLTKGVAEIPYDLWAFFYADPELCLTKEEAKELAEAYFELAQAMDVDFSHPIWIAFTIVITNKAMIKARWEMLQEKERKARVQLAAEKQERTM